jgi:hypothetical protein
LSKPNKFLFQLCAQPTEVDPSIQHCSFTIY